MLRSQKRCNASDHITFIITSVITSVITPVKSHMETRQVR